ncbi:MULTISPECIES: hypothetical protein, partial [unclassified Caballeronia]|uniref:hypothetical protein n=1 Tax=unclassified Caballeronia TaxID=2646786 RepID=UPI00202796AB
AIFASEPPNLPTAVRAADTITTSVIFYPRETAKASTDFRLRSDARDTETHPLRMDSVSSIRTRAIDAQRRLRSDVRPSDA